MAPWHGSHLENLFFASSSKPKTQLTLNLVGSIGVTYRSKIAKSDPKLSRKHWGDLKIKNSENRSDQKS